MMHLCHNYTHWFVHCRGDKEEDQQDGAMGDQEAGSESCNRRVEADCSGSKSASLGTTSNKDTGNDSQGRKL